MIVQCAHLCMYACIDNTCNTAKDTPSSMQHNVYYKPGKFKERLNLFNELTQIVKGFRHKPACLLHAPCRPLSHFPTICLPVVGLCSGLQVIVEVSGWPCHLMKALLFFYL